MRGLLRHPLRLVGRLFWLAAELVISAITFVPRVVVCLEPSLLAARARWLQACSRRALRIFNVAIRADGPIPTQGLLVSNHLSYLDILVLSSLAPAIFVAKREVKSWPVFGWFAQLGGTLFADRERRCQVGPLNTMLQAALEQGALVVLFPEGTSTDGRTVLPFKSALLEPAANCRNPLSASLIEYRLKDGDVGEEVCYWKDMTFFPHLLNLMSKRRLEASVQFSELQPVCMNRKQLARQLHAEVLKLKQRMAQGPNFELPVWADGLGQLGWSESDLATRVAIQPRMAGGTISLQG